MKYQAKVRGKKFDVEFTDEGRLSVDGEVINYSLERGAGPGHLLLIIDSKPHQVWVENGEVPPGALAPSWRVNVGGFDYEVSVDDERSLKLAEFVKPEAASRGAGRVIAPMPGLVIKLLVEVGQAVKRGDGVVIVEAMKMENEIPSPVKGKVVEIRTSERKAVEKGEILAVIE